MMFNCKCLRENKVPVKVVELLKEQKGLRKMVIGGINKKDTFKFKKN